MKKILMIAMALSALGLVMSGCSGGEAPKEEGTTGTTGAEAPKDDATKAPE